MSRFIRSLALKLLPLSLLAMAGLAPALSSAATDPCANLGSRYLEMHANGYVGTMGSSYSGFNLTLDSTGTYHFNTWIQFPNEQPSSVVGTCKDRHIVFTRTGSHFVQTYDGWIFEVGGNEMAGTFSHNGVEKYGWYAIMQLLEPK
jgi:hypothetical protein